MKRAKITRRTFILGGCLAFITYSFAETRMIAVRRYSIAIKNLPSNFDGFTLLHISDLHSKWFGRGQRELIELIKQQKYDIVAITGDLVNKRNPEMAPALRLVEELMDKPVYFVPGNHEWWSDYHIREPLMKYGVKILENKASKFYVGQQHIWILGVDDPYSGRDNLEQVMQEVTDEQSAKILLAHAPNIYPRAIKEQIDLILTGHIHGGQVRLPLIGAVVAPGQGLFPELDYGLYTTDRTNMVITGGLGESVLPLRVNVPPEIVLVTLEKHR